MSPLKKETAYLHLPTYAAGIIYHIGTFLSFALLLVHFANFTIPDITSKAAVSILFISAACGASIFFKRLFSSRLKSISTPDDYFSNLLVTGFHIVSALTVVKEVPIRALLIFASVIFLYIPLGKLNHLLYFFTSRIHLGILFGSRGIWPMKRRNV
jgi:nitrate reductase gamma subunit